MTDNRWAPWGLIHTVRDGYPVLTETAYWHLLGAHPDTIERVSDDEVYVHLDESYRVVSLGSLRVLERAPGRKKPARPAA